MTWYIAVDRINGRYNFYDLISRISPNGFGDRVEYSDGGWVDHIPSTVLPHLKFDYEDDAIAYSLAFGGKIITYLPTTYTDS
jgi:hypothetical protein